jgi:cell wall-associated NlpC family hydrolase
VFRSRSTVISALSAAVLVVAFPASGSAQGTAFSRSEKPFTTISRMFTKAPTDSVVALVKSQVGTRYRYGAKAPGKAFDCSGLVQWVMAAFNLDVPRTSREQAKEGFEIPKDPSQLLPGDLLYFGKGKKVDHVGIYVGEGRYIHAANRRKGVIEAALPTGKLAATWWKGARRLLGSEDGPPITVFDSLLMQRTDT